MPRRAAILVWLLLLALNIAWLFEYSRDRPFTIAIDFVKAYYVAGRAVMQGDIGTLERSMMNVDFVNVPVVAWLFAPFSLADPASGYVNFTLVGLVAVVLSIVLLSRLAGRSSWIWVVGLFAVNGPLIYSIMLGNATEIVFSVMVIALVLLHRGWRFAAGALLGFCAVMKLPLGMFAVMFILRREWSALAGGLLVAALTAALSLGLYGMSTHLVWYGYAVAPFLADPIAAINVQSFAAFLLRLESSPALLLGWDPHPLSFAMTIVLRLAQLALLAGFVWFAMAYGRYPRGENQERDAALLDLSFSAALVLAIIASTLSWTHYYMFLLLPWSLYLGGRLAVPRDRLTRWLMGASIVAGSLPVTYPTGPTMTFILERGSTWLASAWLFSGLCCFAALVRGLRLRMEGTAGRQPVAAQDGLRQDGMPLEAVRRSPTGVS